MIELLVMVIVALIVFWIVKLIIGSLGLPGNIVQIIYLVMALIFLLWLLQFFGIFRLPIRF